MNLPEIEIQNMLRLVAEVAGMPGSSDLRRRHFLRGLATLANSPIALEVCWTADRQGGELQISNCYVWGLKPEYVHLQPQRQRSGSADVPADQHHELLSGIGTVISQLPGQKVSQTAVGSLSFSWVLPGSDGAKHLAVSVRRRCDGLRLLAACRSAAQTPFGKREEQILRLLHPYAEAMGGAVETGNSSAIETLPPHLHRLIPELLSGASEKQIAKTLGYTFNTTHQYIKVLYRRMRVSSRAEFMAACATHSARNRSAANRSAHSPCEDQASAISQRLPK